MKNNEIEEMKNEEKKFRKVIWWVYPDDVSKETCYHQYLDYSRCHKKTNLVTVLLYTDLEQLLRYVQLQAQIILSCMSNMLYGLSNHLLAPTAK